jgi:GNAT superfamily N-acetyltransferase
VSDETVVRRANDDDLDDLVALRYRWRTEEAGETGMSLEAFTRATREWSDERRRTHVGYVARVDHQAVGGAWLCVIDRVPGPGRFERRAGILQSVYVEPRSRDAGVGRSLIETVLEDARAMGLDYVIVHPSSRSFPFYRRLGFASAERALEYRFTT